MSDFPKIMRLGERAILIQFEPEISENVFRKTLAAEKFLQKNILKSKVDITATYNSLLISYQAAIEDTYNEVLALKEEFAAANIHDNLNSRLFYLPVCYEEEFGLDLEVISRAKELKKEEIISLHAAPEYLVYFTGFLPGFLYLGGLDKKLHFPRLKQPRQEVQKGAVGIGENQTGIYPQKSPGGWNIIGNSPVPLFDAFANPPCEIKAGDKIRFYEVSLEEHREIAAQVKKRQFVFRKEENAGYN